MNRSYKIKNIEIYEYSKGYIVYNKNKPFETGHTHIDSGEKQKSFKTAKYIAYLAANKIIPKHLSLYLLESLIRLSGDKKYKQSIYKMIDDMLIKKGDINYELQIDTEINSDKF